MLLRLIEKEKKENHNGSPNPLVNRKNNKNTVSKEFFGRNLWNGVFIMKCKNIKLTYRPKWKNPFFSYGSLV